MEWTLDQTFFGNDPAGNLVEWKTDAETLRLLRQYGDNTRRFSSSETMLGFIFHAGRAAGRIVRAEEGR